jgi:hypothetical protein
MISTDVLRRTSAELVEYSRLTRQRAEEARASPTESQNHRANRQFLLGATRVCFVINWDSTVRGGWGGS